MCESIPDAEVEQVSEMPSYKCLKCQRYSAQNVYEHIQHQLYFLDSEKFSLEAEVSALSDICEKYRQDQEFSMGDSEKQLLNVLDQIGVKRQAYHGNVFVGNHCKVILAKDKNQEYNFVKLCNVLSDEVKKEHFVKLFSIYSEARSLMAQKNYLSDENILTLTNLCYDFGK